MGNGVLIVEIASWIAQGVEDIIVSKSVLTKAKANNCFNILSLSSSAQAFAIGIKKKCNICTPISSKDNCLITLR
mgnify:FL=1